MLVKKIWARYPDKQSAEKHLEQVKTLNTIEGKVVGAEIQQTGKRTWTLFYIVDVPEIRCPHCGSQLAVRKSVCSYCDAITSFAYCERCDKEYLVCPQCLRVLEEDPEPDLTIECHCGGRAHTGCLVI